MLSLRRSCTLPQGCAQTSPVGFQIKRRSTETAFLQFSFSCVAGKCLFISRRLRVENKKARIVSLLRTGKNTTCFRQILSRRLFLSFYYVGRCYMDIFYMAIGEVTLSRLRRCSRQGERCSRYLSMFSLLGVYREVRRVSL